MSDLPIFGLFEIQAFPMDIQTPCDESPMLRTVLSFRLVRRARRGCLQGCSGFIESAVSHFGDSKNAWVHVGFPSTPVKKGS